MPGFYNLSGIRRKLLTSSNQRLGVRSQPVIIVVCC